MLSVYRHGVACTLLFTNAALDVSPYLVRQRSIQLLDRGCEVVEPCLRHGVKATNVRDGGTLEDIQSLLDSRHLVASDTRVIPLPL